MYVENATYCSHKGPSELQACSEGVATERAGPEMEEERFSVYRSLVLLLKEVRPR